jgi:hypothetical protein
MRIVLSLSSAYYRNSRGEGYFLVEESRAGTYNHATYVRTKTTYTGSYAKRKELGNAAELLARTLRSVD